ncbi:HAD family hydrolase [Alicyclobacillus mengziensis]|uniref:Cof-type HAD-IIB family hydrolase n=1 Tax=Alicyclobacillus mengziensis TaxID=2931921 RepID=A0A9X7VUL0_9BACL|nr:HAD family hydrolase [Alicyclobacillus mengziensis]QSO45519.1 Cof-type HAD-IIB family hydrolase [Alicyclobacillus mengziensis]
MDYQAVFMDIDGTLVTERQLVSSAREVVQRLNDRGYKVALCTGRSTVHTNGVQKHLGIENAVYFNGGLAVAHGDVTLSMPLEPSTVENILKLTSDHRQPLILHTRNRTLSLEEIPVEYQPILESYQFPPIERTTIDAVLSGTVGQIYQANVFATRDFDHVFSEHIPECLVYRWNRNAIDLQRLGCDKSIGAQTFLHRWNIPPAQAVHIGDGGNDIGMFRTMGLSIAMGNASDDVKANANVVTDRAENDGVLKALENLQLI